ncbi:hypothetical protein CHUAL_009268 [Chamberlinius hualienensis]
MQSSEGEKLLGKVALITGAANGIGAETAKLFTKLGAIVSLLDLDEQKLKTVAKECEELIKHKQPKPLVVVGNITDADVRKDYVAKTVAAFSKIDILINNAGVTKYSTVIDSPLEDYDRIMDVNIRSVLHLTQLSIPHLTKTKGSIVSLSSVAAKSVTIGRLFYAMSKACIVQFTRYAAQELGETGIRVNCISPGIVKTNICLNYNMNENQLSEYFRVASNNIPIGRCAETLEVAKLLAFLASDDASYITGENIVIDGGLTRMPQKATVPQTDLFTTKR